MEKQPLDGDAAVTSQDRTGERTGEGAGEGEKEEMGKRLVMGEERKECCGEVPFGRQYGNSGMDKNLAAAKRRRLAKRRGSSRTGGDHLLRRGSKLVSGIGISGGLVSVRRDLDRDDFALRSENHH